MEEAKKKKAEEERKKKAEEEAKRVQTLSTTSGSSGSEDSPIRSANQLRSDRVGNNQAKRAIHQQLENMDLDGIKILEQQYLQAKSAGGAMGGATLEGKLSKHLYDRQHSTENCIADTGCSMNICSLSIIQTLKAEISPLKNNLQIVNASGGFLKIVGTATIYFHSQITSNKKKMLNCAILDGPEREVLLSLGTLKQLNLVHESFPNQTVLSYIKDRYNKGYSKEHSHSLKNQSQSVKSAKLHKHEDECLKLKARVMEKFASTFKEVLTKADRLDIPPVHLYQDENTNIRPVQNLRPFDVPWHLRAGYQAELKACIDAGILEPSEKPTPWAHKAFAVPKKTPGAARLVADFRLLNKTLKRPIWPTESVDQMLRHIPPEYRFFIVVDCTSGYHQVPIHKTSQPLTTIITSAGRFQYTTLSQGITSSSDFWNKLTDGSVRIDSELGVTKNMDDFLIGARTLDELEAKITKLLQYFEKINLKLAPSKVEIGRCVTFGGCKISSETLSSGDHIFIEPRNGRVDALLDLETPKSKKELQCLAGMLSSLQKWFPAAPLSCPLIRKAAGSKEKFSWSDPLKQEYDYIREMMQSHIRISPFDGSKKARLVTDAASSTGCGFCLFQLRDPKDQDWGMGVNIINANSTLFKTFGLSPIDAELKCLVFAATACEFWLSFCNNIQLLSLIHI